ncbi:hypothetical protein [Pelagicoccus sp. SDUM812002]|uniref:hypothetical protein n=1 Tax=Pelagicoccus sp. SDUM812002 TaxID=3041266 RepID=UPI00280F81B5|nr:hypothetical protein [Pelagicoccus sp. SDUM812002]MDQ8185761.1 hypothetical protein [Pelagicoccus sp. SDUM812002]
MPEELAGAVETLDRFMLAGKEDDARRGAQLLDMYETSPRKAEREIESYFEQKRPHFSEYVSISKDIYGYELKENGYRGPNLSLEGRLETTSGFTAEFSARLVYREQRWRLLSIDID